MLYFEYDAQIALLYIDAILTSRIKYNIYAKASNHRVK